MPRDDLYRGQIAVLFGRSPFYREKLAAAGFVSPASVGGLERIGELPFTEKDELPRSQAEHSPLGAHAPIDIRQAARIVDYRQQNGRLQENRGLARGAGVDVHSKVSIPRWGSTRLATSLKKIGAEG